MAVTVQTYSVAAKNIAHQGLIDLIDAGPSHGLIKVREASGVLLATLPLSKPCAVLNVTNGRLTFDIAGRDDFVEVGSVPAYADITDSSGKVIFSLPAAIGLAPVEGKIVFNAALVAGGTCEVVSLTVG